MREARQNQAEAIRFYCGLNEQRWNHHPVRPGPYACVAPVYGRSLATKTVNRVVVPPGTQVMQDSGAFSDGPGQRLSIEAALERQIAHAERFGYAAQITHRASYDLLIDEKWQDGIRYKARWTSADAEEAVRVTVRAAAFLSSHRHAGIGVVLSTQGVSAEQSLRCAQQIVPLLEPGDILALGGWCVLGKYPAQMMPVFEETMHRVIPFLGREQVQRVHIWGVCYPPALGRLLYLCDQEGIALSTDSAGPTVHPCYGNWGYGTWRNTRYQRPPSQERGRHRMVHTYLTRRWLRDFRTREPGEYRPIRIPLARQLPFPFQFNTRKKEAVS